MDLNRAIRLWGKTLLVLEGFWMVAWFVIGMIEAYRPSPLPPSLVPGLPLAAYDTVAEYLAAHTGIALHFLLAGSIFLLAAATGDELIVVWYMLPVAAVITKDTWAVFERFLRLSPDAHPDLYTMEVALAVSALSLSVSAFLWFQFVYWRYVETGVRFDAKETQGSNKKHDDHGGGSPVPVERVVMTMTTPKQGYIRLAAGN
jgi:hypothetical protein